MSKEAWLMVGLVATVLIFQPDMAFGSVESTLMAVKTKVVNVILPLAAVLGLVYAGFSFITGNPSARGHLMLAVIGCIVGFGATAIMTFIRSLVN
jgi:type IV secretory pathway VirB2 component (pilin)